MMTITAKALAGFAAVLAGTGLAAATPDVPAGGPSAPAPTLVHVFSVRATLAPPLEVGEADGGRRRFIAITGGTVDGPRLRGTVLAGGGDWQTIVPGGLTRVEARYFLKADDGTVIERLAKGEVVDPSLYYFRTTPAFKVKDGPHAWLQRAVFVARGIRNPDSVVIDYYMVE